MKKNYSNKEAKAEETKGESTPPVKVGRRLICTRECVVPDLGHWISGDVVEDPRKVQRLSSNPNFAEMEG